MTPLSRLEKTLGLQANRFPYYTGPFADYEILMASSATWDLPPLFELLDSRRAVLEIGAGDGRITLALAARGYRVEAVDNSPDAIKLLRSRAASIGCDHAITVNEIDATSKTFIESLSPKDIGSILVGNLTVNHFDEDCIRSIATRIKALPSAPDFVVGALTRAGTTYFERFDGQLSNSLFFIPFCSNGLHYVMASEIVYRDQHLHQRWFVDTGPENADGRRFCFAKMNMRIWTAEELTTLFMDLGWAVGATRSATVEGGGLSGAEVRFIRFTARPLVQGPNI